MTAITKIFGEPRSIGDVRLTAFTRERHGETCAICKKAQRIEDMCIEARIYMKKDQKAQRERLGFDTTGEIRRTPK